MADQKFITLKEVLDMVTIEGDFHKSLVITSDACYSGHWCLEAKK